MANNAQYLRFTGAPVNPQPSGGGFLDTLGHIISQTGTDLKNVAFNAPGGLYHLAGGLIHHPVGTVESVGKSMFQDLEHPLRHPGYTALDVLGLTGGVGAVAGRAAEAGSIISRAGALSPDLAEAVRPALEAGDAGAASKAAGSLGRAAEFSRAVNPETLAPKSVGRQLRDTLIFGSPQQERLLQIPGSDQLQHGWWFSRNPAIKQAQRLVDQLHNRFPNSTIPPIWRSQGGRLKSASLSENIARAELSSSKGRALWKSFGAASDPEHLAVRMVLEGTTAQMFRDFHERMLKEGDLTPKQVAETHRRLQMLPEAEKQLQNVTHTFEGDHPLKGDTFEVPALREDSPLHQYLADARDVSGERTVGARLAGVLTDDSEVARDIGTYHVMRFDRTPLYGSHIKKITRQLSGLKNINRGDSDAAKALQNELDNAKMIENGDVKGLGLPKAAAREIIEKAGLSRVPYEIERPGAIGFGGGAFRKAFKGTSRPSAPSTFTHPFEAGILKRGGGDLNTAKLLAESYTEAQRYIALHHNWQHIVASLHPTPEGIPERYRVLVRRDLPPSSGMSTTRAAAVRLMKEQGLNPERITPEEASVGGMMYEDTRKSLFMRIKDVPHDLMEQLTPDREQFAPHQEYGWADSRLLGGLDKANPLASVYSNTSPVVRGAVKLTDAANAAQKAAILYLKPAYILPNALGNAFLNIVQQGFLAPYNLTKSLLAYRTMDKGTFSLIKSAMGEGSSISVLKGQGDVLSHVQGFSNKLANMYGRIVDDPFRFSAFLHEARIDGFHTARELHTLTHDPAFREQMLGITNRANDEIINYERLGPGEQAVLRRLVFFYPWVKGSSRYTVQAATKHPGTAGATGQEGKQENQLVERVLGNVPSFAEGITPVGTDKASGLPLVSNPGAAAIFSTPAQIAEQAANIFAGHPNKDLAASGNLQPMDQFLLTLLTSGSASQAAHSAVNPVYKSALNDYYGGNPIASLVQSLTSQKPPNALYPDNSKWHAGLRFGVSGGLTPRVYNPQRGQYINWLEKHPRG